MSHAAFRWILAAWIGLLLVGCLYATFHHQQWGYDDAFISYRYAAHLGDGSGLVFNPGERVEGYSNLLYVVAIALGLLVLPNELAYAFSVSLNVLCLVAALWLLVTHLRESLGPGRALVAGLLFAASPPLWLAAWSGMETCAVLLVFVATWVAVERLEAGRSAPALGALLIAMVWLRADGFVMAAVVLAYLFAVGHRRVALRAGGLAAGAVALQVGFRLVYYGLPLPNTYYVKVTGALADRLAHAASTFGDFRPLFPALVAIALAAWLRPARGERRWLPELAVWFSASWLVYWFYVGGDIFGMRFLLPLLVLGFAAVARLWPGPEELRMGVRGVACAATAALLALPFWRSGLELRRTSYDAWIELGRFLGEHHPGALIAVDGAGKIPFYSGLRTVDMLGLNDRHIARLPARFRDPGHSKLDPEYVYSREPSLIAVRVRDPAFNMYSGLVARRYQQEGYRLAYLVHLGPVPPGPPIVDVRHAPRAERLARLRDSYAYAVLEKIRY